MDRLYSYIEGKDIFTIDEEDKEPIIDGILYKGQYILCVAEEKVGKTILAQQLVCNLSSGEPFLETFDVDKPCKVWYMYNEVNKNELKGRFVRMRNGVKVNENNMKLIQFNFGFNTEAGKKQLKQIVADCNGNFPEVIILDALYKAVNGSLIKDDIVNAFNKEFREFANELGGCARILMHHLTKPSKDEKGNFRARTDKDSFGSTFLSADVDHILRLEKYGNDPNTKDRMLKCETQRSGNIIETIRLRLVEPNPLFYKVISVHAEEKLKLIKILNKEKKLTVEWMGKLLKISNSLLYIILRELLNENLISKSKTRPVIYYLKSMAHLFEKPAQETNTMDTKIVSTK